MVDLLAILGGFAVGAALTALAVLGLRRSPVAAPARVTTPPPTRGPSTPPAPTPRPQVSTRRAAAPVQRPAPDATAEWATSATSATTARLEVEDGSAVVDLGDQPVTLGRGSDQTLRISDSRASRAHAVVRPRRTGGWELADDGSANGTTLNGHRVPDGKVAPLRDGDRIGIGGVTVLYRERRDRSETPSEPGDDPTRIA